ncbi:hypothetical protein [Nocardiopsis akebiae]|nr:hypothetical protein [Nocardiopsis akebiae]
MSDAPSGTRPGWSRGSGALARHPERTAPAVPERDEFDVVRG